MSKNLFLERQAAKQADKGRAGKKSEVGVLKRMNAKGMPASGALPGAKSDGKKDGPIPFRIECKSTINESIGLKKDWLDKIAREAYTSQRQPLLTLTFTDHNGIPKPNAEWVVMPMHVFKQLTGEE